MFEVAHSTDDGLLLADAGGFPDAADSLVGLHTDEDVNPGSAGAADVGGEDVEASDVQRDQPCPKQ